jgi:hypothetical protein
MRLPAAHSPFGLCRCVWCAPTFFQSSSSWCASLSCSAAVDSDTADTEGQTDKRTREGTGRCADCRGFRGELALTSLVSLVHHSALTAVRKAVARSNLRLSCLTAPSLLHVTSSSASQPLCARISRPSISHRLNSPCSHQLHIFFAPLHFSSSFHITLHLHSFSHSRASSASLASQRGWQRPGCSCTAQHHSSPRVRQTRVRSLPWPPQLT